MGVLVANLLKPNSSAPIVGALLFGVDIGAFGNSPINCTTRGSVVSSSGYKRPMAVASCSTSLHVSPKKP